MKKLIPFFLLLVQMVSCETLIEPNLPEEPAKTAVYSFFRPDASIEIDIFSLTPILEPDALERIGDINVSLYENDKLIEAVSSKAGTYTSETIPAPGNTYRFEFAYEETVLSGQSEVPYPVEVLNVNVSKELVTVNNGELGYPFVISITDPASSSNYYSIELLVEDCFDGCDANLEGRLNPIFFEDLEVNTSGNSEIDIGGSPNVDSGFDFLYFDDNSFNGESIAIKFNAVPLHLDFSKEQLIKVILKTITKEYYEYLTTSDFQNKEEEEGDFSEPVQVFTNIVNGTGVFAGYNYSLFTVRTN